MGKVKAGSWFLSIFLRILLTASWILLVMSYALSFLLLIWPNITVGAPGIEGVFGVWQYSSTGIINKISWLGWILIAITSIAFLFSLIVQTSLKNAKFKIGSRNQIIGYFSVINFPLIICVVFTFLGTYHFNSLTSIPGVNSVHSMFLTNAGVSKLINSSNFPLKFGVAGSVTWIYWIFLVFNGISIIPIIFTTIKLILRAVFSRTVSKSYE